MLCLGQLCLVGGAAPWSRDPNSLNTTNKSLPELEDLGAGLRRSGQSWAGNLENR